MSYLLEICADATSFDKLDEAADWLCEGDNGVTEDFVDSIYAKAGWSPYDMVAELCLRVANRLGLEGRDMEKQRLLTSKGLMLVRMAEKKLRDAEGNVTVPIAYEMHEPVYNALEMVARQMGVVCEDGSEAQLRRRLDVHLPPSYLKPPVMDTVLTS